MIVKSFIQDNHRYDILARRVGMVTFVCVYQGSQRANKFEYEISHDVRSDLNAVSGIDGVEMLVSMAEADVKNPPRPISA